jgi:SAM-dependent methyltransferase
MTVGSGFDLEWRARFERYARTQPDEASVSGWSEAGLARRLERFEALLPALELRPPAAVLDLGCGAGTYTRRLADRGYHVTGIDYSLPTVARARGADVSGQAAYAAADGYRLPFGGETFDLVVTIGVLQAVSRPEAILTEAARVLRRGRVAVFEVLNAWAAPAMAGALRDRLLGRPPRVRRYRTAEVRCWLRAAGLEPVRRVAIFLPPRRLAVTAGVLDLRPVTAALTAYPALVNATAQAYLWVARKP